MNLIIWGSGTTAKEAMRYVSKDVNILGFLDNNPNASEFEGLKMLNKNNIHMYEFDYIVICTVLYWHEIYEQLRSLNIEEEKILIYDYAKIISWRMIKDNYFENKWKRLSMGGYMPQIINSGISYFKDGIDETVFEEKVQKKAFNFALGSQDIFYDLKIAQFLDKEGYLENVTHYLIGLSYYSFEYDFSKSVHAWHIVRYYPYIMDTHNFISKEFFADFVKVTKDEIEKYKICDQIFNKRYPFVIDKQVGMMVAKSDFNKNYPVTVWENKKILKEFLSLLIEKNIKPIILIMPATEGYVEACPIHIKEKFYTNLQECLIGYNVQILDYFGKYYGDISDYYHVTHFNKTGARKFTMKLVEDIEW